MTSALERLDGHIEEVEDYLSSLREQRKALLLVDQSVARLEHVPPRLNRGDSHETKDGRVYRH